MNMKQFEALRSLMQAIVTHRGRLSPDTQRILTNAELAVIAMLDDEPTPMPAVPPAINWEVLYKDSLERISNQRAMLDSCDKTIVTLRDVIRERDASITNLQRQIGVQMTHSGNVRSLLNEAIRKIEHVTKP